MKKKRLFQVFGSTVQKTQARVKPENEELRRTDRKKEKCEVDRIQSIRYIKKHIMRHKFSRNDEYESQNTLMMQKAQLSTKDHSQKILFVRKNCHDIV